MTAWLDEFRIVKGKAVWTSAFTPSTSPYAVGDTAALIGHAGDVEEVIDIGALKTACGGHVCQGYTIQIRRNKYSDRDMFPRRLQFPPVPPSR